MVDTGIGMEEETIDLIFDPYYSTKSNGTGRGLGLSSVYAIMQRHKGGILINSQKDVGTTISIAFPKQQDGSKQLNHTPVFPDSIISTRQKVLIVEDEKMIRALIKRVLEEEGYEVELAKDGLEGVALFNLMNPKPSILITDVVMPEMRGSELVRQLRQQTPELMVLFVSGYPAMELGEFDLDAQNTSFLAKPFKMSELIKRLKQLQLSQFAKDAEPDSAPKPSE